MSFRIVTVTAGIALFAAATPRGATAGPLGKSISTSRQFVVYASDPLLRGGICDLAERTKRNLLTLVQARDEWKTPIVVHAELRQASAPDAPPSHLVVSQTGFGLKLQLDLTLGEEIDATQIQRELLRTVVLERMYRNAPDISAGAAYVQPPDWLLDGALALAPDGDPTAVAETLASLTGDHKVMPFAEVLQQRPELLESPLRAAYRAYAAAVLSMLIEAPDGRTRLLAFLADLPHSSNDPLAEFKKHFPQLGQADAELAETWKKAVARLASREGFRMLNCAEMERELAALLSNVVPATDGSGAVYTLDEFPKFVHSATAAEPLKQLREKLLVLSGRSNPLYAPIISEYQQIAMSIARQKTRHITERLARLRGDREEMSRRMAAIDDYINWFEATQSRTASGAFAQYMKAAERAAEGEPHRRDPISRYLDAVEALVGD